MIASGSATDPDPHHQVPGPAARRWRRQTLGSVQNFR